VCLLIDIAKLPHRPMDGGLEVGHRRASPFPPTFPGVFRSPLTPTANTVHWVSHAALTQLANLNAAIDLLTLPVRFSQLSREEILEEGRQEEAAPLAMRVLFRRFGEIDPANQ
jgi:hypothetical protein